MVGTIILISILVLVIIVVAIYLIIKHIKSKKNNVEEYDFITKYGTKIKLSPKAKGNISKKVIEDYTDDVVNFWYVKKAWSKEASYKIIGKIKVELFDVFYIQIGEDKYNGIFWASSFVMEISTLSRKISLINRVESLFRHEASHAICEYVGKIRSKEKFGEDHHRLFKEVGLNA